MVKKKINYVWGEPSLGLPSGMKIQASRTFLSQALGCSFEDKAKATFLEKRWANEQNTNMSKSYPELPQRCRKC